MRQCPHQQHHAIPPNLCLYLFIYLSTYLPTYLGHLPTWAIYLDITMMSEVLANNLTEGRTSTRLLAPANDLTEG